AGVRDDIDNCTPPKCRTLESCFTPDQTDSDNDGVGDTCDNCAPSVCTKKGLNASICKNADQADLDKDGVGDVCDLCPAKRTTVNEVDKNADGVGDSCDLCPATMGGGGRRACKTTSDCAGHGVCLTDDVRAGQCSVGGTACGVLIGGAQCTNCAQIGMWGACSEGTEPDTDGDGIGDRCDSCPSFKDANLQQNSNAAAEAREGA